MGDIKIMHNQVSHKNKDGTLELYFPHDLDATRDPEVLKVIDWANKSGFKCNVVSKSKTKIIYPSSFDIANCFYERDSFDYVAGLNKTKGEKLSLNDFFIFLYYRFIKGSKICDKSISCMNNLSEKDLLNDNFKSIKYFNYMCNSFHNVPDEIIFTKDLKKNIQIEDYIVGKILKSNLEKKVLFITSESDNKKMSNYDQFRILNLPHLNCKGLKGSLFHDMINHFNELFGFENRELYFNIICGMIYSKNLLKEKIDLDLSKKYTIVNSGGFFITKTYSKMRCLSLLPEKSNKFNSNILEYTKSKSKWFFNPTFLYEALMAHCENINKILDDSKKDLNEDKAVNIFLTAMMEDLILGMKFLGMFLVEDININLEKNK